MNEFEWPEYCVNICKVAGAKTMIEKTQLLTWLSLLTNAGYTLLTPEEQDFIKGDNNDSSTSEKKC